MELLEKEQMEIRAWRDSPTENPRVDSVENLVNKLTDAPVFLEALQRQGQIFKTASSILELGAGQGWAACIVKKMLGDAVKVVATDISSHAVASVPKWERVFGVSLDAAFACRSYSIPVPADSVDVVFTFQAAHHFVAHGRTLREIARVLASGGTCLYLHEPTCHQALHGLARRRVNTKGMPVPEDVLIYSRLRRLGEQVGLRTSSVFDLSTTKRGPVELAYYSILRMVPPLAHVFPCTRDIVFRKV